MPCDYYVELMLLHRPTPALLQHSGRSRLHHPLWLQRGYSVATAYLSRPYDRGLFHLLSVVAHQPQRLIVALDCHVNNPKMRLFPSPEAGCLAPKLEAVGSSSPSRDAPAPRTRPCLPTPAHPPSREVGAECRPRAECSSPVARTRRGVLPLRLVPSVGPPRHRSPGVCAGPEVPTCCPARTSRSPIGL